jgi:hypothetical protein
MLRRTVVSPAAGPNRLVVAAGTQPLAGVGVVEPGRVDVGTGGEKRRVEGYLRCRRRPVVRREGRCLEIGGLRRAGRGRLLQGQLQQAQQPRVLCLQPRQLSLKRHGNLSHANKLSRRYHRPASIDPARLAAARQYRALGITRVLRLARSDFGNKACMSVGRPV